ncbi:MAG: hypothetical protein EXQ53_01345 [Acidobacteria bacterium]|nr:hypothetical protein [Acidobacteriota bacterium]
MTTVSGVDVRAPLDSLAGSLFARVVGTIRSPRATCETVARAPRWCGVLTLTFLVTTGCTALLLETDAGQLALLDQWERAVFALGQTIDDVQYAAMEDASRHGTAYAALSSLVGGPFLVAGLSALIFTVFRPSRVVGRVARRVAKRPDEPVLVGRSASADRLGAVTYRQVLALVSHAGVILALRQVVAAPVAYARETLASPLTMGVFASALNEASALARFLGILDLFVIWWLIVLAIGVSVLYRRPAPRLAAVFVGAYVTLAVVLTAVMAVTGGTG